MSNSPAHRLGDIAMQVISSIRENLIAWSVGSALAATGSLGVGYYHFLKETVIEDQLQSAKDHRSEGFRMFQQGETALAHFRYGQAAAVLRTLAYWGLSLIHISEPTRLGM